MQTCKATVAADNDQRWYKIGPDQLLDTPAIVHASAEDGCFNCGNKLSRAENVEAVNSQPACDKTVIVHNDTCVHDD